MTYLGISRDCKPIQTSAQLAAAENICVGYGVTGHASFLCRECHQSGMLPGFISHAPNCNTAAVLEGRAK